MGKLGSLKCLSYRFFNTLKVNIANKNLDDLLTLEKMPFYAVAKGRTPGIFMKWNDCEAQVKGFSGARYKKFDTVEAAQQFINLEGGPSKLPGGKLINSRINAETNINLKRSYSTSSYDKEKKTSNSQTSKSKLKRPKNDNYEDDSFSDNSDDLNTVLTKQMDDIEKRLKGFEKGVEKIIKNSTVKSSNRQTMLIEPPQTKKQRTGGKIEFEEDNEGYVQVYTDGACSGNGRTGARAGLGVFWGNGHPLNISKPVSGRATNNCGEIQAATRAIKDAVQNGVKKLAINTDSQFLINSVTKWMPGWKRKGWKLKSGEPVKNEIDFKDLDSVLNQIKIKWNYVEAHRGIHGNEMADQLAKEGAAMYSRDN